MKSAEEEKNNRGIKAWDWQIKESNRPKSRRKWSANLVKKGEGVSIIRSPPESYAVITVRVTALCCSSNMQPHRRRGRQIEWFITTGGATDSSGHSGCKGRTGSVQDCAGWWFAGLRGSTKFGDWVGTYTLRTFTGFGRLCVLVSLPLCSGVLRVFRGLHDCH